MVCVLAGCSDGGSDNPVNPTPKPEEIKTEITIDSGIISNGLSFASSQSEQSVSFSVNADWTLSVASTTSGATWCKASATSGGKGSANVKFTIDENTSYDDRSVSVTIKAGMVSKTFTITQKGADAMLVTTTKYEVAQDGGKIEVEVKANVNYQFAISETSKDWITEAKSKTRGLTTYKHTFDIAMNEESEKREGEITFKSGDKVETVKVYQAGGAIILLTQNEYTVSDAGETISVNIKSNVDFGVQMPDVDWITDEASSRGMSSHTLKYVIAANEGYDSRSAEIIFYDKNSDLTDTLKVIQAQKDAIVISQKTYDVKSEGETIEVKLSANVDFEVTMPDVDWVKQVSSRTLKEHTLYFEVAANEEEGSRSTEIIFTNKGSNIDEKIVVTQQGSIPQAEITIEVTEPGTLKTFISEGRVETLNSLKVIGNLNGDDFNIIRRMRSLKILDLAEANIVKGGSNIQIDPTWHSGDEIECVVEKDDVLIASMIPINVVYFTPPQSLKGIQGIEFVYYKGKYCYSAFSSYYGDKFITGPNRYLTRSALSYTKLFENVENIGDYAFAYTDLSEITIPDNVSHIGIGAFKECNKLQRVLINKPLNILEETFSGCGSLSELFLPEGVEEIGKNAFAYNNLKKIVIPSTIAKIHSNAFYRSGSYIKTDIHISDINSWCNVELDNRESSPFYSRRDSKLYVNDTIVSTLSINGTELINSYVFANCKSVEKVVIGNLVKTIGVFRSPKQPKLFRNNQI